MAASLHLAFPFVTCYVRTAWGSEVRNTLPVTNVGPPGVTFSPRSLFEMST